VPMRPEVKVAKGEKPVDQVKQFHPTNEQIDKGIPEAIEDWRDTFGN